MTTSIRFISDHQMTSRASEFDTSTAPIHISESTNGEYKLTELKNELLTLRVQKIAGGSAAKLTKMYVRLSGLLAHSFIRLA